MTRIWKWTVLACAGLASAICVLNIAVAIWATTQNERTEEGNYIIDKGNCRSITRANIIVHVFINILSVLLLASSNFCMQLAIAPTRDEVDKAHAQRRWLDIGVASVGNLRYVSKTRALCWLLLAISSLPLHLVYNSTIYTTSVVTEYVVAEMDPSYLETGLETRLSNITAKNAGMNLREGSQLEEVHATFRNLLANSSTWTNMTSAECAKAYSTDLMTSHRTLVLVVEPSSNHSQLPGLFRIVGTRNWMCDDTEQQQSPDRLDIFGTPKFSCNPARAEFGYRPGDNWKEPGKTMYCLSEPFEQQCTLEFSPPLLITTIIANAVKAAMMIWLFYGLTAETLMSLGDAVQSFLQSADPHTWGLSTLDARDLKLRWTSSAVNVIPPTPAIWTRRSHRRHNTISGQRLLLSYGILLTALSAIIILLVMAIRADTDRGVFERAFSPSGILDKDVFAIIGFETFRDLSLSGTVVLVNTPQLILSMLYFLFNATCTAFMEAQEWNDFAGSHKQLRVTNSPNSKAGNGQRPSVWLSLPPLYSITLMICSAVLHWLVSQAIFMTKIQFLSFSGKMSHRLGGGIGDDGELLSASYSSGAIMLCLVVSALMVLGLITVGFQKLEHQMTMAGSCSAVISAACQVGVNEGQTLLGTTDSLLEEHADGHIRNICNRPLRWGDVAFCGFDARPVEQKYGTSVVRRVGFSAGEVTAPTEGVLYM